MSQRAKGLNTSLVVVLDGKEQAGSFTKCESFEITPDAEIKKSDFLGESTSDGDMQHHGYDFKFTIHEQDKNAIAFYSKVAAASEAGTLLPEVDVMAITQYPDPSQGVVTEVLHECVIKLDSASSSGRKEYKKNSFSGFAKRKQVI